jgi:DNA-directed RNA polymerase subunit H (RpoH/RPB5)
MDYETLDVLYKSRQTLLKILAGRGYDTKPFEKFGPIEISAMAAAGAEAFRMDLQRQVTEGQRMAYCRVVYSFNNIKNRIATFLSDQVREDEEDDTDGIDRSTTELIVMLLEPVREAFHLAAAFALGRGIHVSFFCVNTIVNNPLEHVLVPKHELLPSSEHTDFLAKHKIRSKENLPLIRFHEDMIARIMGLMPGDIVKITRPSPSAGEYTSYRLCTA